MKYCIIVPDGMADYPLDELDNRTPLETAATPNMDLVAREGRVGQVRTVPEGFPPGSDVAIMSLVGYDPRQYFTGRAPLEAAARGIKLEPTDWAFRCNLVTVSEGNLADFSAGHIQTKEAGILIEYLAGKLGNPALTFYTGVGYRHLMVSSSGDDLSADCVPPHDIMGEPLSKHLPNGNGADFLTRLMKQSSALLEGHDINRVRLDLGENPANMMWLWGQGRAPQFPSFKEKYGKSGAVISAVDLVNGLATYLGWDRIDVPGATGYYDTDYAAKGQYAIEALETHDIVMVHIEAPDEASHNADPREKIKAIEEIDARIVGPVIQALREYDEFRVLVMADHVTSIKLRTHAADPVPFGVYGKGIESLRELPFTESAAAEADLKIDEGHELMSYFLG